MRLLLTGFEPFNHSTVNPSQEVVRRLADDPPAGCELHTAILPVEHQRGPQALLRTLETSHPDAVVCLGESGRAGLSIERVAINLIDDSIPDNAGERVMDRPAVEGGPTAYFVTLPVRRMQEAILAAGVPVDLSLSAGAFLCNQVAYTLLHYLATSRPTENIPAGFIHLPRLPEQAAARQSSQPGQGSQPSLDLGTQVRGVQAALKVLVQEYE
jgi:pyroglutamyl-peptidase